MELKSFIKPPEPVPMRRRLKCGQLCCAIQPSQGHRGKIKDNKGDVKGSFVQSEDGRQQLTGVVFLASV